MAEWVYEQEVRQELPNRGRGVSGAKLEEYISDGHDMVTLGDATAVSTTLGRRAVRAYAKAEALKKMRANGDPISVEDINLAEESADRFAAAYRVSTTSTTDDSGPNFKARVGRTPW